MAFGPKGRVDRDELVWVEGLDCLLAFLVKLKFLLPSQNWNLKTEAIEDILETPTMLSTVHFDLPCQT